MAKLRAAMAAARRSTTTRRRAPKVMLLTLVAMLVETVPVSAASFTTFSGPFTGANDFVTGMPTCTNFGPTQGPIGLLQDGTHFFMGDSCDGIMYRYPSTGGSTPDSPTWSNNLDGGMAVGGGAYYGITLGLASPKVQQFDPNTLLPTATVMTSTSFLYDVLYNPQTGDLWVSGRPGLYRVTNPSTSPTATLVIPALGTHEFDGIALSPDDSTIWVADHGGGQVFSYDVTSDAQTHNLASGCAGPDGVAVAPPNTVVNGVDVSNDVFVNCNDGSIHMVDPVQGTSTLVASGGTRGDLATVGPDGCMYVTQADRIEQLLPCFFAPRFGARGTGVAIQSPLLTTSAADTGFYSNPNGGEVQADLATENVPPVTASVLRSTAQTFSSPPGGEARGESAVADVSIDVGGHTIAATSLDAVAETTCSGSVAGYSIIGEISVDGSPSQPVKAQNVVITLGPVVVTLNEIDISGGSGTDQQTQVTSIHVQAPSYDVRVSTALARADAC